MKPEPKPELKPEQEVPSSVARTQSAETPGSSFALPRPTYWPFVMAASISFALWGVLTSPWIVAVGVGGVLIAAKGWIGDLSHEPSE
jgi:fatty acid desaturase